MEALNINPTRKLQLCQFHVMSNKNSQPKTVVILCTACEKTRFA